MSLYRTWRPKSFNDLVGQDAVVRTLTTAIDTGRLAHAYLFSGPRGSGKTSAAKILARCIECMNGPTATPDNDCENCRSILAGTALDVLEIDAASNRGIDEIRALRDAVKFAPATMRMKVYIIDEAHMLTKEGANAFLKTLEEPPPYAVFILATTAPEALPPTILSRCQRYAFRRIPIATMIARMRSISDAERIVIDDAALGAIAYRADGGLRDALTMLEQVAAFANGPVDVQTVDAAFGASGREFAKQVLVASLGGDAAGALTAIENASDAGTDMPGLLRSTIAEFRHLLVARVNPELLARDLSGDDAAAALEQARATPQTRLIRGLRFLSDALAAARGSGNARLEIETAILRFVLQEEESAVEALAARVAALERSGGAEQRALTGPRTEGGVADPRVPRPNRSAPQAAALDRSAPQATASDRSAPQATAPDRSAPQAAASDRSGPPKTNPGPSQVSRGTLPESQSLPPSNGNVSRPALAAAGIPPIGDLSMQKIGALWQNVRARAESAKMALNAPLSQTTIAALEGDVLTLSVPHRTSAEILRANIGTLQSALDGVLGRPLRIQVRIGTGRTSATEPVAHADTVPVDLVRYAIDTLP